MSDFVSHAHPVVRERVGVSVGDSVGTSLGAVDGNALGNADGMEDGAELGCELGVAWNLSMDGPRSNRPFEVFAQCRCVQLRDRFMGNRVRRPRPVPRAHAFTSGGCGGTKRNTANFAIQFSSDNDERNGTMLGI